MGACSPRKIFIIRHSEIVSEVIFGPKNAPRISPPVVSVAREVIEPSFPVSPLKNEKPNSLVATLNA